MPKIEKTNEQSLRYLEGATQTHGQERLPKLSLHCQQKLNSTFNLRSFTRVQQYCELCSKLVEFNFQH